ncbi:calcium-dependent phosphotriesterase [Thelephora ganbajun]|uniref:Calcium-dependent phosphotriesterase n=1 Tax=Thelephora ganbajun TaxID=370292 RepID=A0ACB6Z820_THEGA|nr:calcium-dependent phosphotriesterase [Thelephora ganbajun]
MTTRLLTPFLVVVPAILFGLYQIRVKPLLEVGGVWKEVQDIGRELKETCTYVNELKGCEQSSLHEPSGVLFLACTPPASRSQWLPFMGTHNTSVAGTGYIVTYDPSSKKVTKLAANGFNSPRGLSPFGMDVVPSTHNPDEFTIYVVNMRPPFITSARAKKEGPDPSIEVFRYVMGGDSVQHVATWTDEKIVISPNDVVGLPDGKGVWFTNPLPYRTVISNAVVVLLQQKLSSIGFCGVDGCKLAATGLYGINGIARSPFTLNDTFYVAHTFLGGVSLFTRQSDNRLLLDEHIKTESGLDNLMVDSKGAIWAAGIPKVLAIRAHILDPIQTASAPSSVFKITLNIGESSFYGEKYIVQKVLEDDGTKISGITSAVHDASRGRLFMHGVVGESLIVCKTK